jgi:tRNA nucleotidyltransferase (CCA-adding enzyme)
MIIKRYHKTDIQNSDEDFVVVGSDIDNMEDLGYKQVGKHFPVFIHPNTGKEYALARKETKDGHKHSDFKFDFNKNITLEEDLIRRDFTINSIAVDLNYKHSEDLMMLNLIDPFNGKIDIKNKIIRHINSEHFIEDPLRILRACRFAAQLNFTIADDTLELLKYMIKENMLNHISKERIYNEFKKAFSKGYHSDVFIKYLDDTGALEKILPCIYNMKLFNERLEYHGEGTTYNHMLLVLREAQNEETHIKFGCLFHDVGKYILIDNLGRGHDSKNIYLKIEAILLDLRFPNEIRKFIKDSIETHMDLPRLYNLGTKRIFNLLKQSSNNFKNKQYLLDLIMVSRCDRNGRIFESNSEDNKLEDLYKHIINIYDLCSKVKYDTLKEYKLELNKIKHNDIQKIIDIIRLSLISSHISIISLDRNY